MNDRFAYEICEMEKISRLFFYDHNICSVREKLDPYAFRYKIAKCQPI